MKFSKWAIFWIKNCPVLVIVARRHFNHEESKELREAGCEYEEVDNINDNLELAIKQVKNIIYQFTKNQ